MMERSTITNRTVAFQEKSQPTWLRSASLAASSGRAPSRVPEGHRYLQKAGTLANPVNKNAEPIPTSPTRTAYFPYFKIRWKGRRFRLRNSGILCSRS